MVRRAMTSLVLWCLLLPCTAERQWSLPAEDYAPDLEILSANARKFMANVEKNVGAQPPRKLFEDQLDAFSKFESHKGPPQVRHVRDWVKAVGPQLGKPEYREDAPLHEVLLRADELLGLPDQSDQDHHPFEKAHIIIGAMKAFQMEVLKAYDESADQQAKDEL
jgi:hypothetical protein